jgi:hypothetical protein
MALASEHLRSPAGIRGRRRPAFPFASLLFLAGPLLAWILCAAPLSAQIVEGRVLDVGTEAPVEGVAVELLAGLDDVQIRVATDAEGRFRLRARSPGTYRIRAGRIGYETVTTPLFDLVRDEDPLEVEVLIGVEAVPLAPMVVVSERPARVEHLRLHLRGFYERDRTWGREGMGFGQFRGPEELEGRILFSAIDAVQDLRGVRIVGTGGRGRAITVRGGGFGRCSPPVYVDGVLLRGGGLDSFVSGSEVLAVEVYQGITGPPEFVRGECGAVVIWTGAR